MIFPWSGTQVRVFVAFWAFGLMNNLPYVIILSAALDLVGTDIPKGTILLSDAVPSFLLKLLAPYFIHKIHYALRVVLLVLIATLSMLLIALTSVDLQYSSILLKMVGVACASVSSSVGELNYLSLTHFYGHSSLAAWSSGTGAAGLVGGISYVAATTWMRFSPQKSLLAFSVLPLVTLAAYFYVLPRDSLGKQDSKLHHTYSSLAQTDEAVYSTSANGIEDNHTSPLEEVELELVGEGRSSTPPREEPESYGPEDTWRKALSKTKLNLQRTKRLILPFMMPLFLASIPEFCINQGVAPTLLFPLQSSPFKAYRDFYPTYSAIYQVSVFISRSFSTFFRIDNLWVPALFQLLNLLLLIAQSTLNILPNIGLVFLAIFWEGLLSGVVYVNTFSKIIDKVPPEDQEFSLGATSVSDTAGAGIAGLISLRLEPSLCHYQVSRGRDYCQRT